MTLADRVAIVTGAGTGIGKATALALARAGARARAVRGRSLDFTREVPARTPACRRHAGAAHLTAIE